MKEILIAPMNSILFISGSQNSEISEITRDAMIWATDTCVAFATFPEIDGETRVILGGIREVDPGRPPDMDTPIDTPNGRLIVESVGQKIVLDTSVSSLKTRVSIWRSHPQWPEEVRIGIG